MDNENGVTKMIYELQNETTETMTGHEYRYFEDAYRKAEDLAKATNDPIQIWDQGRYLMTIKPKAAK